MANPRDVFVDVNLRLGSEPPFELETGDLRTGPDNRLYFKNNRFPGFRVHFRLNDPDNLYAFPTPNIPDHLGEALYSVDEARCPKEKGQWHEFKAESVRQNGLELVVRNMNETETEFGYTLRVTKDGGQNYLDLDPIGTNQNCNSGSGMATPLAFFVGGAAVGGAVALTMMPLASTATQLALAIGGGLAGLAVYALTRRQRALAA